MKTEPLLDSEDLAFLMESEATSPAISDVCDNNASNDSSNEALVVDCDRSGSNTPGKSYASIYFFSISF